MAMQVHGWNTVYIAHYIISRASLEATGRCHWAHIYAVLRCNAQVGTVVIGFRKMILVQDVEIGAQIFGPYFAQINDGFFKMSSSWIRVWWSKDQ